MHKKPARLAAIDLGTNSFHLVVADVKENGSFTVLGRDKEVVRLGEGKTDMKHLSDSAMRRALEVLKRFSLIARSAGATVRPVATSAVREAINGADFVDLVRNETGLEIEVVSGYEEARLIYLGVVQALPVYNRRVLLVDIGGGSTEFLLGRSGEVKYANSVKLGSLRLTHRFFSGKTLKKSSVAECRAFLTGVLDPIRRVMKKESFDVAVGSSGTILNVAAMVLAERGETCNFDEGNITFTRKDLDRVVRRIIEARTVQERKKIPGLDPSRADIIPAGILILEQIFNNLGVDSLLTSKYALREGIILDTIQKMTGEEKAVPRLNNIRRTSVLHLGEICRFESDHAATVERLSLALFDATADLHRLGRMEREYLEAASILHDIGYHISHSQHHRHSWYIIRNSELLGFTEREKEIIANVARYHRKSHPKLKHEEFSRLQESDRSIVRKLASILRITDGLDRRHRGIVTSIRCSLRGDTMKIISGVDETEDCSIELWGADRRKQLFEEVFGLSVALETEDGRTVPRPDPDSAE